MPSGLLYIEHRVRGFGLSLQVCQASGLLLVGHAKGEARLYQYSSTAQHVTAADLSSESRWGGSLDRLGLGQC